MNGRLFSNGVILKDTASDKKQYVKVDFFDDHICICPEGYGDKTSKDGHGAPIMIEIHEGKVKVILWSDINQEDPTHNVDMSGAMETKRVAESP